MQQDNERNHMLTIQFIFSTANFAISCYTVVVGVFGMNIPNKIYQEGYMFKYVVGFTFLGACLIFFLVIAYARWKGMVVL